MSSPRPIFIAISGIKNSGKTTLIAGVLPLLSRCGLRVAVIKHDGHSFEPDVPGTDSYIARHAGAYGTAVFSGRLFQIVKEASTEEQSLALAFPEADLVLLEGFKHSAYPKIELVRRGNSEKPVGLPETLLAVATDIEGFSGPPGVPIIPMDPEAAVRVIIGYLKAKGRL